MKQYKDIYQKSIDDPDTFWGEAAEQLDWIKKWDTVSQADFKKAEFKWFAGGKINIFPITASTVRLNTWRKNKAAIIFEGEPGETRILTYQQLYTEVCKFVSEYTASISRLARAC